MKTILYYTCCEHNPIIETACRRQLQAARGDAKLIAISLKPIEFGDENIVLPLRRSPESMHKQILAGLERAKSGDAVFLCESDVLYHPSHFDFELPNRDTFFYNTNVWRLRFADGHAVWTDDLRQVSGLCADRDFLLIHYFKRVDRIEREGKFDLQIGYEPGAHDFPRGIDYGRAESRMSAFPNVDIRHDRNITLSKWSPAEFRNRKYAQGWKETDGEIAGWGTGKAIIARMTRA